ncbi:uncharacterized protein B0H18DRAFT_660072 [Fomitopsis serialis]|uniref:uncharacterized protein n=1 Tax=Fomitopsis serialis TaxID=139415 RepID=UPI0020073A23|nr:uncharacterized protein B0H18DRAFT_660072 [Neoantrodia serialis]KAH9904636.1 hypothetical protein B0H18DRAFT_660072 [Neoantrodia serialis]
MICAWSPSPSSLGPCHPPSCHSSIGTCRRPLSMCPLPGSSKRAAQLHRPPLPATSVSQPFATAVAKRAPMSTPAPPIPHRPHPQTTARTVRFAEPPHVRNPPKLSISQLLGAGGIILPGEVALRWSYLGRAIPEFGLLCRVRAWDVDSDGLLGTVEDMANRSIDVLDVGERAPVDHYRRVRVGDVLSIRGRLKRAADGSATYIHPLALIVFLPVSAPLSQHLDVLRSHRADTKSEYEAHKLTTFKLRNALIFDWLVHSRRESEDGRGMFDRVPVNYFQIVAPLDACMRLIMAWRERNFPSQRAASIQRVLRDIAVPLLNTRLPNLVEVVNESFDTLVAQGKVLEAVLPHGVAYYY